MIVMGKLSKFFKFASDCSQSPGKSRDFLYIRKVLTENELCKPITLLNQDIENRR